MNDLKLTSKELRQLGYERSSNQISKLTNKILIIAAAVFLPLIILSATCLMIYDESASHKQYIYEYRLPEQIDNNDITIKNNVMTIDDVRYHYTDKTSHGNQAWHIVFCVFAITLTVILVSVMAWAANKNNKYANQFVDQYAYLIEGGETKSNTTE